MFWQGLDQHLYVIMCGQGNSTYDSHYAYDNQLQSNAI